MKKMYLRRTAVSTLFVLLALSVVSVSAQPFEWNSPRMVLVNASPAHITAIAVDPVTEAVYGIDDAQNIVTITGVEVTDTKDAEIGAI